MVLIPFDLNLFRSYACCHSLYEVLCTSVLLGLEDTVSLKLSTTFDSDNLSAPLQHRSLSLEEKNLI